MAAKVVPINKKKLEAQLAALQRERADLVKTIEQAKAKLSELYKP